MLAIKQINKIFPDGVEAIKDVSFTIQLGEFVSIVGPSGAGKSTLLRAICGLDIATHGSVSYNGRSILSPHPDFALVFQDYRRSLYGWLTLEQNITLPLRHRIKSRAERSRLAQDFLLRVGLAGLGHRFPEQLSGGQQQRVAIARALACQPKLLIMDEPFASVDAQTRFELEDLVLSLTRNSGIAALLVTHDIDEATYMSDRIVLLSSPPTYVAEEIDVTLPWPRNQSTTRALKEFSHIRSRLLSQLLSNQS